jgi:hypothetical protein
MARRLLLSIAAGASIFAAMAHLTQASANPLLWLANRCSILALRLRPGTRFR